MIEVRDLSLCYANPGNVPEILDHSDDYDSSNLVLRNLRLNIMPGKVYGLIGRNGAGKTSLLNCITGLIWKPSAKKVFIDDRELSIGNPHIMSRIFYVTDTTPDLHIRVDKHAKTLAIYYPDFSMERFNDCVEMFNLDYREHIDNLSLGQRKMAMLSFAFASNAPYLILDEPTNGLDITSRKAFRKLLAQSMSPDRAIIISTHHINEVSTLLDHILILDNKRIVFDHSAIETGSTLKFIESDDRDLLQDAIYSMSSAYGNRMILQNESGSDSEIDYELLFEAVLENGAAINKLFSYN